jgi:hypothetical protein
MSPPWSSELAAGLRRDREELLTAFLIIRAQLRDTHADEFAGGEDERSRLMRETEHDSVALASAGAEAVRLETMLEPADREVTGREADSAALVIAQMHELVTAVAAGCRLRESIGRRERGLLMETSWKPQPAQNPSQPPASKPPKCVFAA